MGAFARLVVTLTLTVAAVAPAARADQALICDEIVIPMSDGVRLYGLVNRVGPDEPRPVVFTMTPYGGTYCRQPASQAFDSGVADRFVEVLVHTRGSGASEGVWDMMGARTQQDVDEVLDWVALQPWSNGTILLTGRSGPGLFIGHGLHHPAVKAAVVFTTCTDLYHGCTRPGGGLQTLGPGFISVAVGQALIANRGTRDRMGLGGNPPFGAQLAALNETSAEVSARDTFDEWFQERDSLDSYADADIPIYLTTDQYDIIPGSVFDAYQVTPGARLSTGLGHGTVNIDFVDVSAAQLRPPIHRFVRHYILGEDNGAEDDPPVRILTNLGSRAGYAGGQVLYRDEPAWPLPDTRWEPLYLGPPVDVPADSINDGTLNLSPAQEVPSLAMLDATPVGPATGPKSDLRVNTWRGWPTWTYYDRIGATDLSDDESSGLTYSSAVLQKNLEITGPIALRVFATSTVPDFDWVIRLTDVWPDGRSEWVGDGYLRASLRRVDEARSLRNAEGVIVRPWQPATQHEFVPVGEVVEYLIQIHPISNVFQAGHRLRVDVFGSGHAAFDAARTAGSGIVTIHRSEEHPSSILLPVIPARCQDSTPIAADAAPLATCAASLGDAFGEA